MIEAFYCIQDALRYMPTCVLCRRRMNGFQNLVPSPMSSLKLNDDISTYGATIFQPKILYTLVEIGYTDVYEIDVQNSKVSRQTEIAEREERVITSYTGYSGPRLSNPRPPIDGTQYLYLGVKCRNCHKYEYALQLVIDLKRLVMMGVILNSETCIFQKNEMEARDELRNVYTTKKTIYSHLACASSGTIAVESKQDLPLLPLDRENPHKTLERAKKLLIFT